MPRKENFMQKEDKEPQVRGQRRRAKEDAKKAENKK